MMICPTPVSYTHLDVYKRQVKYHMGEIMAALHLEHRAQVLAYAGREGLGARF